MGNVQHVNAEKQGLKHGFRALRHRDFAIFWSSAVASSSGTWLQNLTVPWVLFQLTGSAFLVGLAAAAQSIPMVLASPAGGALADRFEPRRVLLCTQTALAIIGVLQFLNWQYGVREPWLILTLVTLAGFATGLNQPSWQSMVNQLVPREDLRSAVSLNSMQINLAKAIGPGLAGVLLATLGPGPAFLINAASTLAVLVALCTIRTRAMVRPSDRLPAIKGLWQAGQYVFAHPGLRIGLTISMLIGFLGFPVFSFTIILARQAWEAGSGAVGALNACLGLGAVLMGPILAGWDQKLTKSAVVRIALPLYGLTVMAFGLAPTLPLAMGIIFLTGAAFFAASNSAHAAAQMIVREDMRGRVLALKLMAFMVSVSAGSAVQGALADIVGARSILVTAGILLLVAGITLAKLPPRVGLRRLDDDQDIDQV